jgi:hypothetical protein
MSAPALGPVSMVTVDAVLGRFEDPHRVETD